MTREDHTPLNEDSLRALLGETELVYAAGLSIEIGDPTLAEAQDVQAQLFDPMKQEGDEPTPEKLRAMSDAAVVAIRACVRMPGREDGRLTDAEAEALFLRSSTGPVSFQNPLALACLRRSGCGFVASLEGREGLDQDPT